jgi:ferric-dicitrate binding protein FerR (iron transport regulator)
MSERLGPPPVDALSDVAWARVERNVFSRTEGTVTNAVAAREVKRELTRSTWVWLAVPAAAAAAFAFAFFPVGDRTPAATGEPSRVVAGSSPSTVSYGDAHVTLQANSAVVMDHNSAKPTALLEHGSAVFAVAPRGDRGPFTVLAGDMSARTINATFTVTRSGERADVSVASGRIGIRFRGHDLEVTANQRWSSEQPAEVTGSPQ